MEGEQEIKYDCPIKMCQQKCKDRNRRKEVLDPLLSVSSKTGVFEVAVWLVGTLGTTWRLVSYGLVLSVTTVFTLVASLCTAEAPAGHT